MSTCGFCWSKTKFFTEWKIENLHQTPDWMNRPPYSWDMHGNIGCTILLLIALQRPWKTDSKERVEQTMNFAALLHAQKAKWVLRSCCTSWNLPIPSPLLVWLFVPVCSRFPLTKLQQHWHMCRLYAKKRRKEFLTFLPSGFWLTASYMDCRLKVGSFSLSLKTVVCQSFEQVTLTL